MCETSMKTTGSCVIAGGSILDMTWAQGFLGMHADAMTIACDSGIQLFSEGGKCPDIFVGDFDSADPETVAYYKEKEQTLMHPLPVHKDVTDTEEALHIALEAGCDPIYLIGMTGGRIDHTLANVCLLRQAAAAGVRAYLLDPYCKAYAVMPGDGAGCTGGGTDSTDADGNGGYDSNTAGRCCVQLAADRAYGDYISLIPLGGPVTGLTITGAEYPLKDAVLAGKDSLGISNRLTDDVMTISFTDGELLIIEARDSVI